MGDEKQVVKVVTTINTGVKPIPVNSQDAINMARQNANTMQVVNTGAAVVTPQPQVQVVQTQPQPVQQIVMTPINQNPNEGQMMNQQIVEPMPLMPNNQSQFQGAYLGDYSGEYSQEDVDMVNDVNDLVKVVDVKYSKKTVLIMVGVIAILVIIFLVFELPMLMEM